MLSRSPSTKLMSRRRNPSSAGGVTHPRRLHPVAYAEIPGAQHAFELFPSLRTTYVIHGVERFLAYVYSQYLSTSRSESEASPHAAAG